jgi:hypothetical protein
MFHRVPRNNFWIGYFTYQLPWMIGTLLYFVIVGALFDVHGGFWGSFVVCFHIGATILSFVAWIVFRRRLTAYSPNFRRLINDINRFWCKLDAGE